MFLEPRRKVTQLRRHLLARASFSGGHDLGTRRGNLRLVLGVLVCEGVGVLQFQRPLHLTELEAQAAPLDMLVADRFREKESPLEAVRTGNQSIA